MSATQGPEQKAEGGTKFDAGKNRLDLLPFDALGEVGRVLTFGANKYDDRNWEKGMSWGRCLGAGLRHVFAWARGERKDPETGLNHLAHAICCFLFLLAYDIRGVGTNDVVPAVDELFV